MNDKELDGLEAYADVEAAGAEAPSRDERIEYLRMRHAQIKVERKSLMLQREESDARKDDATTGRIRQAMEQNYKARKYIVRALRELGETVDDPYVPA